MLFIGVFINFKFMAGQLKEGGLLKFFTECLQDLYNAEKKFVKCAAALSIAAYTEELQTALLSQSHQSENHTQRLEEVFKILAIHPAEGKCKIIEMLSDKSADIVKTVETGTALRDAAIIYAVQLIAHYKIACYGSLIALLEEIEEDSAQVLLERCLVEEKSADTNLTQLAMMVINPAAKRESA
jgi:ferritin-like metal-binding protein YciE